MYIIIKLVETIEIPDDEFANCTATGATEIINKRVAEHLAVNAGHLWTISETEGEHAQAIAA